MTMQETVSSILHNATGKRASGRELLLAEKSSILAPEVAETLKEQWQGAGRDNALVVMRMTEADGSNPHYVTGWDGKDTFVCMTESGLSYVPYRRLEKLMHDPDWDATTRLIQVRAPLLRESMERADVDMLLDRIKKTLVKSNKQRRKSRLRNMEKFFSESETSSEKSTKSGPKSSTEFIKVDEKDERAPKAAPPGRNESVIWDKVDERGSVVRRPLNHPMMQAEAGDPQLSKRELVPVRKETGGGGTGATPGGNKSDPQMKLRKSVDVRSESGDPQLSKRQQVRMNKEGKGGGTGATPGGNKTDPQMTQRELVDVRHEEKTRGCSKCGCDGDSYTTYAGEHGKCPECGSRPEIVVRSEALSFNEQGRRLFGPGCGRKSPMGAKKPILMLMLIKKGKGPKKTMSEETVHCPRCGKTHFVGGSPHGPMLGLVPPHPEKGKDFCPSCEAKRARGGGALTIKKVEIGKPKPPSQPCFHEELGRGGLTLVRSVAENVLSEKWGKKVDIEQPGKYKGWTLAKLKKAYSGLKKSGPHKKGSSEYERMREISFAIRAKTGWGKISEDLDMVAEKFFGGDTERAKKHGHKFLANIEMVRKRAEARRAKA